MTRWAHIREIVPVVCLAGIVGSSLVIPPTAVTLIGAVVITWSVTNVRARRSAADAERNGFTKGSAVALGAEPRGARRRRPRRGSPAGLHDRCPFRSVRPRLPAGQLVLSVEHHPSTLSTATAGRRVVLDGRGPEPGSPPRRSLPGSLLLAGRVDGAASLPATVHLTTKNPRTPAGRP